MHAMKGKGEPRPTRRRRLQFAVLSIIGALAFAELGAAFVYYLKLDQPLRESINLAIGSGSTWAPGSTARYQRHPYLNFVGNPAFRFPDGSKVFNQQGFRDTGVDWRHKPDDALRLVVIGGSTTFGWLFEDPAETWPNLLADRLTAETGQTVEILNAGLPAYATHNLIGFCAFWLPELDADVVVVHTGFNDAFAVAFPGEGGPAGESFHRAFAHRPIPQPARSVLRASHLARMLSLGWLRRNGFLAGVLAHATMQPRPTEPEVAESARTATGHLFERNLSTIVRLIRSAGAVAVVSNIPMKPEGEKNRGTYYGAAFEAARRNNTIAGAVAETEGAAFVDLYRTMHEPAGFVDSVHLNEIGMRAKADALFPVVRDVLLRRAASG